MLHEFKRPMWNDGYSKEQPWLNYFNSYERMHCCFEGDADGNEGGGDDDVRGGGTGSGTTGSGPEGGPGSGSGTGSGTGGGTGVGTGGEGVEDDVVDVAPEGFSIGPGTGMGPGPDAADPEPDARDATYNAATNSFNFAVDTKSDNFASDVASIGFENFENPSDLDLATMNEMYNNPDAYGMGYNDFVDMGFFDKSEAADYAKSKAEAAALEASYKAKGKDVNISVAKDGTYSYTGKDAGTVGLSEMGKGLSYAMTTTGIGGLISGIARTLGITEEEVTKEDIQTYGGLREESISSQQEKDSKGIAGPAIDPSYGGATLASDFDAMQQQADADRASAYSDMAGAEGSLSFDPTGIGYGGAALGGMTDAELQEAFAQEAFDLGIGPSSPGYGGAALGGMTDAELQAGYAQEARDMSSAGQPDEDETFGEDETDEGVQDTVLPILPTPEPEEEVPETAMEAYFRKLGIATPAGPVAPSSFQQYRSYLPPIGPAANAAYRRKLALGTPRYMEPSGPNPSISTLAAVYGLTYEEAAKKFAFPSVPAASGGGLNSLMRYK